MRKKIIILLLNTLYFMTLKATNDHMNNEISIETQNPITIHKATERALLYDDKIQSIMLEIEKSHYEIDKNWKNAFFKIDYSANLSFFTGNSPALQGNDTLYSHSIRLVQPIYQGAIKPGVQLAKTAKTLVELKLNKQKKESVLLAIEKYINVLKLENTLEILKISEKALEKNYEIQNEKYKLRMATRPDILDSETKLIEVQSEILNVESQINLAKQDLGNLIGIYDTENMKLVHFSMVDNFSKKINLSQDLKTLSLRNTEYQMLELTRDINQFKIEIEKAIMRPTVSFFATYGQNNRTYLGDIMRLNEYDAAFGVNVSWQIFDWGQTKSSIRALEKDHELADLDIKILLKNLELGVKQIYSQIKAKENMLEVKRKTVEKAVQMYELEQERYSYQLITLRDVLNAEVYLRQTKIDYIHTKLEYYYLVSQYGSFFE